MPSLPGGTVQDENRSDSRQDDPAAHEWESQLGEEETSAHHPSGDQKEYDEDACMQGPKEILGRNETAEESPDVYADIAYLNHVHDHYLARYPDYKGKTGKGIVVVEELEASVEELMKNIRMGT